MIIRNAPRLSGVRPEVRARLRGYYQPDTNILEVHASSAMVGIFGAPRGKHPPWTCIRSPGRKHVHLGELLVCLGERAALGRGAAAQLRARPDLPRLRAEYHAADQAAPAHAGHDRVGHRGVTHGRVPVSREPRASERRRPHHRLHRGQRVSPGTCDRVGALCTAASSAASRPVARACSG